MSAHRDNLADVQQRFDKDIETHEVHVLLDSGLHRHLWVRRPDTINHSFNIVTWPGYLAVTGDMGDFVFRRTEDMFQFFRDDPDRPTYRINPYYWGQKLVAGERATYSRAVFDEYVNMCFDDWLQDEHGYPWEDIEDLVDQFKETGDLRPPVAPEDESIVGLGQQLIEDEDEDEDETPILTKDQLRDIIEVRSKLDQLSPGSTMEAHDELNWLKDDSPSRRFSFLGESCDWGNFEDDTYHFLWCLHAIVWSIEQYDEGVK